MQTLGTFTVNQSNILTDYSFKQQRRRQRLWNNDGVAHQSKRRLHHLGEHGSSFKQEAFDVWRTAAKEKVLIVFICSPLGPDYSEESLSKYDDI